MNMILLALNIINIFAEGDAPWWDYPGFELWKFVNLAIFLIAGWYLHHKFGRPITEGLRMRKEDIRRQLAKAKEERDKALQQLAAVEAKVEDLQSEVAVIREKAQLEAKAERERILKETEAEMARLQLNAKREIEVAGKAAIAELRRFSSEQSIRRAEEFIRRDIRPEDEMRLLKLGSRKGGPTV